MLRSIVNRRKLTMKTLLPVALVLALSATACASAAHTISADAAKQRSREDVERERAETGVRQMQEEFNRVFGEN